MSKKVSKIIDTETNKTIQVMFGDNGPFGFNADIRCPSVVCLFAAKNDGGLLSNDADRLLAVDVLLSKLRAKLLIEVR